MKTVNQNNVKQQVLKAVALGAFVALPLVGTMTTGQADPPSHAPAWGYRNKGGNGGYGRGKGNKRDKRDKKGGRRGRDEDWDDRDGDWRNRDEDWRYRNRDNGDWRNRGGYGGGYGGDYGGNYGRTLTGTVVNVESNERVDVNVNGRIYNVFTNYLPREVSRGDVVRVSGVRRGDNNIENATVSILRNG